MLGQEAVNINVIVLSFTRPGLETNIDICCFSAHSIKEKEQRLVGSESG
jgi:hypothetical protein